LCITNEDRLEVVTEESALVTVVCPGRCIAVNVFPEGAFSKPTICVPAA